ncbi:MAG: ABC transporter permease, partial [Rhizobiales bacterium]|nr:ABC transporter permease [Hyphomicrobiales bacterium]
ATEEALAALREKMGLNAPPHMQYLKWLGGIVQGDFGRSQTLGLPISDVLIGRFGNSLQLTLLTILVAAVVAIPLGVWAAIRQGQAADSAILTISYLGISIPDFVFGPLLILLLATPPLALLPSSGYVPLSEDAFQWLRHMILPVAALTAILTAHLVRQTRSGILEVLQSDYVRTARLKGLPERKVLWRHCLRNGLSTTVTVLALDLGFIMGSIVVFEEVYAYPGIGRLTIFAIGDRDIPLIQAATLLIAAVYIAANILADLIHSALNPKVG